MTDSLTQRFRDAAPAADFWSFRSVDERSEHIQVRQDILQPVTSEIDRGVMVTVMHEGGLGYAATSDTSPSGLREASQRAMEWAARSKAANIMQGKKLEPPTPTGSYESTVERSWSQTSLRDKVELLKAECARLKVDDKIVDWDAMLWSTRTEQLYVCSGGGEVFQQFEFLVPGLSVTANQGSETVSRNFGGFDLGRQGGMEVLDSIEFAEQGAAISREVLELLAAPNCPTETMDVLLDATQMYLQIHESIGHPLELDRILGDERNYAGTSFVTLDMFGSYRYGSDLLNITFDPGLASEFAGYAYDDDGTKAEREYIIKDGILKTPLGGMTSQLRSGMAGVANSRACSWNRPPIDRMANLNLEPGESSMDQMIAAIEDGVYMKRNNSWSIDDSRNKFQFGCEYGRRIRNGELAEVVKKPNYKGISATFWRNLKMVGNLSTQQILGTPHCGKGEPNQSVRVGHATPACVFSGVDIFGGE
ncbi:MAG: putative Zn-dependent protease [Planctomycetota bacterium]|jgi:predicted Zn-dependent protease